MSIVKLKLENERLRNEVIRIANIYESEDKRLDIEFKKLEAENIRLMTELRQTCDIAKAFLNYFNPSQLSSDKENQWLSLHDQIARVRQIKLKPKTYADGWRESRESVIEWHNKECERHKTIVLLYRKNGMQNDLEAKEHYNKWCFHEKSAIELCKLKPEDKIS